MKEDKPEWYERLKRGPFRETVFDSKMRLSVEARDGRSANRQNRMRVLLRVAAGVVSIAAIIAFFWNSSLSQPSGASQAGGSGSPAFKHGESGSVATLDFVPELTGPATQPTASSETRPPAGYPALEVRAFGESDLGRFALRPKANTTENIHALGAPSCLGEETDLSITGSYEMFFTSKNGTTSRIAEFNDPLEFIQKENKPVEMQKYTLQDAELFLLIPRYRDCHGMEAYAYGIDRKTGESLPYTFQEGDRNILYWTTSPVNPPAVVDNRLVIEGGLWAGMDGATRYRFKVDMSLHRLVVESKEHVP